MAQETPREPDGTDAAKTRDAGRPVRATARAATARAAARPDLDARNERMVGPRKPMGPPLTEPPAGLARRRAAAGPRAAGARPTDPASPAAPRSAPRRTRASARTRARRASAARKRRS
jgi:hypothetical protein